MNFTGRALPILFNTDMVLAILENRKTSTRRAVRYKYNNTEMKMRTDKYGTRLIEIQKDIEGETHGKLPDGRTWHKLLGYIEKNPPYRKGDTLYVRETWSEWTGGYLYKAWTGPCTQPGQSAVMKWHPSIHMPKEAARIFLKVTDVRAEQLQDITKEQILMEGGSRDAIRHYMAQMPENTEKYVRAAYLIEWQHIWDSTVKKAELGYYGWDANPWVWVIEFDMIDKLGKCE